MILIYACMIFATVTSDSTTRDKEYTPNVGTVLFSARDAENKQWTKSELGLLQARKYFQNILPPPIFINTFNEDHIKILLAYFKDAYAAVKKEAKDPETDSIMTTALSDAIGGYFKVWVLPIAKLDYYGGTISQANVVKLFQFYNEIKRYLDTDGEGWHTPEEKTLNSMTINVAPLQLLSNTRSMTDPCDHLAYFEKTPTGLSIPIPNVNWNDKLSTMFVPLKNASLISMNTPSSSHNLIKYYDAARSCIQTSYPKEQDNFDEKFQKWLTEDVVPHLKDEHLYLALGSVLTLVNKTRDICNNFLDLYVTRCNKNCKCYKCMSKMNLMKIPCDVSNKKMWILIVILLVEIAWCVPALVFILCSKKLHPRDCSSNVYLFIDNEKKGKGEGRKISSDAVNNCPSCKGNVPGDLKILRKSLFKTNNQCLSSHQTNIMEPGTVPCTNQCASKTIPNCVCVTAECKCPDMCYISKRSSLKKSSGVSLEGYNSTQIVALSSHETFASKQSAKSCVTIRSKPCISSERVMLAKNKKKRDSDEYRRWEDCKKPNECRQSEECRKLEERRQAEECRKLDELRKAEECRKLEQRRQAEECRKLEESRQAEECRKLEELIKSEECRKLEERRQAEECRKLEEYRKAEECRKLEEQRKAEEYKQLEAHRLTEECKKLEEQRLAEECRELEELRLAEEYMKHEERRQAKECRRLEERRQAEECKKLEERRQAEECKKLDERRQAEEYRKYENYRNDERRKSADSKKSADSRKYEKPDEHRRYEELEKYEELRPLDDCRDSRHHERKKSEFYKNLEEKKKLIESKESEKLQILDQCKEVDECWEVDEPRGVNEYSHNVEYHEISESREFKQCEEFDGGKKCVGPSVTTVDSYSVTQVNYDNTVIGQDDCNDNADNAEPISCRQVCSQETCRGISPYTACVASKSSIASNVTCCNKTLPDVKHLLDQQVETKPTRFQVTKELKAKGKWGSKLSPGNPFLEITIERPGAEISVDMTEFRHFSQNRPSKIPKPATCSIQPYILGRQSTASGPDKHKSLIPQLKKKTADDIDLGLYQYSKSLETKLNGSF